MGIQYRITGTIGQLIGILVLKKFLKLRDTWVLIISILTFGASNIPVAFPSNFNMYLSNWIGALGNIPSPVLSSLLTHYVEPDEVRSLVNQNLNYPFYYQKTWKRIICVGRPRPARHRHYNSIRCGRTNVHSTECLYSNASLVPRLHVPSRCRVEFLLRRSAHLGGYRRETGGKNL